MDAHHSTNPKMTLDEAISLVEAAGIECRRQSTYFGDEVCAHIYGNDVGAAIYSVKQFIEAAPTIARLSLEDDDDETC